MVTRGVRVPGIGHEELHRSAVFHLFCRDCMAAVSAIVYTVGSGNVLVDFECICFSLTSARHPPDILVCYQSKYSCAAFWC